MRVLLNSRLLLFILLIANCLLNTNARGGRGGGGGRGSSGGRGGVVEEVPAVEAHPMEEELLKRLIFLESGSSSYSRGSSSSIGGYSFNRFRWLF
ncbi:hypothetical protein TNCV_1063141 [Trichonephila clavipes]|nr:hypothetical protein TNCV_1063141 [Trichonephila clavipes]